MTIPAKSANPKDWEKRIEEIDMAMRVHQDAVLMSKGTAEDAYRRRTLQALQAAVKAALTEPIP